MLATSISKQQAKIASLSYALSLRRGALPPRTAAPAALGTKPPHLSGQKACGLALSPHFARARTACPAAGL